MQFPGNLRLNKVKGSSRESLKILVALSHAAVALFSGCALLLQASVSYEIALSIYALVLVLSIIFVCSEDAIIICRLLYMGVFTSVSLPLLDLYGQDFINVPNVLRASESLTGGQALHGNVILLHMCAFSCMVLGMLMVRGSSLAFREAVPRRELPMALFTAIIVIPTLMYLLVVPRQTILSGAYSEIRLGGGIISGIGFAGITSVTFLAFGVGCYDLLISSNGRSRVMKLVTLVLCSLVLVLYADLLRGNRDTANLVVLLLGSYVVWAARRKRRDVGYRPIVRSFILVIPAFLVFTGVQYVRDSLSHGTGLVTATAGRDIVKTGTWMGAFFTTYGYVDAREVDRVQPNGVSPLNDFLLSLPPGPITRLFNIERPYDRFENTPAGWYGRVGNGGAFVGLLSLHVASIPGLAVFMFGMGLLVGWVEKSLRMTPLRFLLFCAILECSMRWLWYSNMNMVRSVMAALIWALVLHLLGCFQKRVPRRLSERSKRCESVRLRSRVADIYRRHDG